MVVRRVLLVIGLAWLVLAAGLYFGFRMGHDGFSPLKLLPAPKPLLKYTYNALKERKYGGSDIKFTQLMKAYNDYSIWKFMYSSDGKQVSGVANLPKNTATESAISQPTIIMVRGYAEPKEYYPGFGTERLAALLAQNGFVTLAPDFLGYGDSDKPSGNVFEERFETYTTVLNLIAAVESNSSLPLGIWGHSNGGQIALSVLEISGKNIPTVLWNPVSITFPYSILYYTWDSDDHGQALRKNLARFEENYNTEEYSPTNFLDWINGPVLLQQGAADESVPQDWSNQLVKSLKSKDKNIEYIAYAGADHNMMPKWEAAARDTLKFFQSNL